MKEYELIKSYYGNKTAERSGVPYINHINEGIKILQKINAGEHAIRAYCLHPLLQHDKDLIKNWLKLQEISPHIIVLTMEYRRVANNYLSTRKINSLDDIELSPLIEVNQMLLADKMQNRKDFLKYHLNTHPRADEIKQYFENWISKLKQAKIENIYGTTYQN